MYVQVILPWLADRPEAYRTLCQVWASSEWIEKSKKHRHRRAITSGDDDEEGDEVQVTHTYGGDGHIRMAKRMVSMLHYKFMKFKFDFISYMCRRLKVDLSPVQ